MTTETDLRLRSRLDTNQRAREQMCRAVLALDARYTDVRPRHPAGGPDGGRDIEATFECVREAYGAVGFVNGANDSAAQKRTIRKKFSSDVRSALAANPHLKVFAFLTNLQLTIGEQDALKREASKAGIEHCDIFGRERIRIELDQPAGFFIRFQYLSIPLSEAEQASFLARYGSQIQEVVTTGFERVEKTLNRLLFLTEATEKLDRLTFRFILKRAYSAEEIGHLRAFIYLTVGDLLEPFQVWFGTSDRADRFRDDAQQDMAPGIGQGRSTGQWESYVTAEDIERLEARAEGNPAGVGEEDEVEHFRLAGWSSGIGMDPVPLIIAEYRHGAWSNPERPRLSVRDLDDCMFLPFLNAMLSEKLHSFQIFANGYKLADYGPADFNIDDSACGEGLPGNFNDAELADPWVRVRPSSFSSAFHLRFFATTPRRVAGHEEPADSPTPPREVSS